MIFGGRKKRIEKLHNEAVSLFEAGDYGNSVKRFAKLCDKEPNSERLYYLGVLFDMLEIPEESAKALDGSVKMDPSNWRAWYSLAVVQQQSGDFEGAFVSIQAAHKIAPDDFQSLNLYALLRLNSPIAEHRNEKHALELATRACELTGNEDELCLATLQQAKAAAGSS